MSERRTLNDELWAYSNIAAACAVAALTATDEQIDMAAMSAHASLHNLRIAAKYLGVTE